MQALRAAEAGTGVLLGSLALCRAPLEAGRLQRLTERTLRMEAGYWLTWARSRPEFAERRPLVECLALGTVAAGQEGGNVAGPRLATKPDAPIGSSAGPVEDAGDAARGSRDHGARRAM